MKTYDEVFQNVMEATNAHRRKVKRIQNMVSASAICVVCIIGASMYMKLEKPESVPPEIETTTTTVPKNGITDTMNGSNSSSSLSDPTELNYTTTDTTAKTTSNPDITIHTNTESSVFSETDQDHTSEINESSETEMTVTIAPQESVQSSATTLKQEEPVKPTTEQASNPETKPVTQTNSYATQTALPQTSEETAFTLTDPSELETGVDTKESDPNDDPSGNGTGEPDPTDPPIESLWTTGVCESTSNIWATNTDPANETTEPIENPSEIEIETTTTTLVMITEPMIEEEVEPNLQEPSETNAEDFYYMAGDVLVKQTVTEVASEFVCEIS